ncbi:MAG: T9SS type A sorting domain-containing protein [Candidatus Kapabacteria bacterium]|nr:T9SS type A sorting domain-containing protein [Candidatus Kapabacteria bacterium]
MITYSSLISYHSFILENLDKDKNGLINKNEMPYFSDKFIKSLSNDVLLESRANEVIVKVSEEILSVKIVSINGVELLKMRNKIGNDILPISLQSLQNGLYLLVIESKDGVITKPIIISK